MHSRSTASRCSRACCGAPEPAIQTALDQLRTCIDARDAAVSAYDVAFQRELAARDAMIRAYDSVANTVRSRFPKDRPQQDVFFETLRSGTKNGATEEPVVVAPPAAPAT